MSKEKQSAGGKRIRFEKGPEAVVGVRFVSAITGEVRGEKEVEGHEVDGRGETFVSWQFDGRAGTAEWIGGCWQSPIWDDEVHARRFPATATWIIRNFGIRR